MRLANKQVVIIGGSSGIGLASARLALDEGASVLIAGRSSDRLDRAVRALNGGPRVQAAVADIADQAGIAALFATQTQVDHVFVTAGELRPGGADLLTTDLDALRSLLETRIIGLAHVVRAVRSKLAEGGSIVLMSGSFAVRPGVGGALGAGSIAAVEGMTRALALDLAPLRVNAVAPGVIDTPLWDTFGAAWSSLADDFAKKLPVGRIGRPDEVAEAVVFLMTNGYVTGTVLRIDGGGGLI